MPQRYKVHLTCVMSYVHVCTEQETPMSRFVKGYGGAVSAAVGIAVCEMCMLYVGTLNVVCLSLIMYCVLQICHICVYLYTYVVHKCVFILCSYVVELLYPYSGHNNLIRPSYSGE